MDSVNNMATGAELIKSDLPYLIFKVNDSLYAVNGETITSIFVLEQQVTAVPRTDGHIKGIINVRGEVLPLVDLKVMFNIPTTEEDDAAFSKMLEERRQDHYRWINALRDSVENDVEFTLATDPHKCKLGKWRDTFQTSNNDVMFSLAKLDEPHQKMHQAAIHALECKKNGDAENLSKTILKEATDSILPELIATIDEMEKVKRSHNKQMVIILQNENTQIGVLVDEVLEVTEISQITSLDSVTTTQHSRFVRGVCTLEDYEKNVLLLDVHEVVNNSLPQSLVAVGEF